MSENKKIKSEVFYKKVKASLDNYEETILSAESETDKGAWDLFTKLAEFDKNEKQQEAYRVLGTREESHVEL